MTKKTKSQVPALVVSSEPSVWMSCRIITPNLEAANFQYFGKTHNRFSLTVDMERQDVWELARKIFETQPSKIVFICHAPHPEELLKALSECYGGQILPPLYFHIYGDFTLYTKEWLNISYILERTRVKFICASARQVRLVSRFLNEPEGAVDLCPFPVNTGEYFSSPELRTQWRKDLGIKDGVLNIVYTGRLSLQKNITRLAHELYGFEKLTNIPVRLLIAGSFDDLGAPFFGITLETGYFYQYWNKFLKKFPKAFQSKIDYLGYHQAETLRGIYNAADCYASLSLHHDEDFGMSPAEALCTGLPVVLTDWGGYASFQLEEQSCRLVPMRIGKKGLSISVEGFRKALLRYSVADLDEKTRKERASRYQKELSVEKASVIISETHKFDAPIFRGFGWRLRKHVELFKSEVPFQSGPVSGTFYEEIYSAYAGTS